METVELIAVSALILSLLLLLKVISLQRQLNELKSDQHQHWRNNLPEVSGLSNPNLNAPASSPNVTRVSPPVNLDERLRMLLTSGKKIQAIKEFREASGLGLKEAKDYVENLERNPY
ncbi:ribosomal protein L7/L12 [Paenibacillus contaminans]|uniref:Large ribosomal subunit protein bL12 C-terminal domain-containing protein n=1 Tax=Paenibacillus contaminans TaxID=450362 RepID=A0A329LP57_9BACL|nr:ribosomal protein L7/L12 [Paenibacillus contaminans]RAV08902.1 hypothetical protein DQG23_40370 [Paenibacillus contaminans]